MVSFSPDLLYRAAEYVRDMSFQTDCQKVLRIIGRKDKGDGVTYRDISRNGGIHPVLSPSKKQGGSLGIAA